MTSMCPCGNELLYSECCEPFIKGIKYAPTAEKLMRSRYSAYAKTEVDYLIATTYPSERYLYTPESIKHWSENSHWLKLEIVSAKDGGVNDTSGKVEFVAHYVENGIQEKHHELSDFKKEDGKWYFVHGASPEKKLASQISTKKVGRNDPCPCGSGKKYKKCCCK